MYRPRKSNVIFRFFSWYIDFIISKDFNSVQFNKLDVPQNASILLLANHFSWWDGFFMYYINKKQFKRNFHVLVSEHNYKKVRFLKYLGAFAAKKGGRDVLETLDFAATLLENPNNLVLFFPQGKLESNHLKSINFEKGVSRIVRNAKGNIQIVFAATFIDYFEDRKPTAISYLSIHKPVVYESLQVLKNAYNQHYRSALLKQTEKAV